MSDSSQINKAYLLIALSLDFATHEQALEGTCINLETLDERETIDASDAIQLVINLNKYSYTPNWATILGGHLGIATHGPVGYASLSAPTIGKALATFVEWYAIRAATYSGRIIEQDECFEIIIMDTTGNSIYQEFFFEAFIRAFEVLIAQLIGRSPNHETEIHFITHASNRKHLMEGEFDSRLHFGKAINKLVVPKTLWYMPSPLYDKDSYEFNLRKCQQLLEELDVNNRIDLRVKSIIRKHLEQAVISSKSPTPPPTQTEICNVLHLTERTLIRKLKLCKTAYKHILEEERREFADRLLRDAKYTIFNIADILGYRESANFCRAFKKWYGQSPTAYRRSPKELK